MRAMKNILITGSLILALFSSGIPVKCQKGVNGYSGFRLGVSQVNVTPSEPTLMSGYSNRTTPFTGVHDSIYASALFFTGASKSLIITSDLIGFSSHMVDDLKAQLSKATGVPGDNILVTAVHNHGGPSTRTYEKDPSGAVDRYVSALTAKIVKMAVDASKNTVPFKMGIGKGSCSLNINRRALYGDGYIGLGRDQEKPCDHELIVASFEDLQGKLIAILVNWPCHGTVSGKENYLVTGDWPGAAARFIKKQAGKNVIVAVTAGASADINPIYGPGTKFSEIEAVGYHIARETLKILPGISVSDVKTISASFNTFVFPGKQPGKDNKPPVSYQAAPDVEIRLSGLKIGDLVIEGISGELMTEIGMQVKKLSPYANTMIITHCNGSSGYICTDAAFPEGGYEIMTTRLMPGVEKPLILKFLDQIHSF